MKNTMETYRYRVFEEHVCDILNIYDVQANNKEEADKLISDFFITNIEHSQIEHLENDVDVMYETMCSCGKGVEIFDEDNKCIND